MPIRALPWSVATAALWVLAPAYAAESGVPVALQANLLVKVAAYDRASDARSAPVLVVERDGDVDSQRVASQMEAALGALPNAPRVQIVQWTTADEVASLATSIGAHIVYVTTTLTTDETLALGASLAGKHVLTAAADPRTVPEGVVLAFDLVSGQTKILVNLPQAKAQGVDFDTALLSIAKVYR